MKYLESLFKFYINASIHVALAVYAFLRITELYFDLPYNETLNYTIFFGSITAYNFVKYAGIAKLHHRSLTSNLKIIQIFSLICFVITCYYGGQLSFKSIFFLLSFGIVTALYAIPFLGGFKKSLRNVSSIKIIIISLVWAGVTVLLPIIDVQQSISLEVILLFVLRLLFVIVLTLPFDIRDINYDGESLRTIPQKIGVENAKKVGYVLLLLCLVLEFIITPNTYFRTVFLIIFFVLLFLLMRSTAKQSKYYSAFWVESLPIFWWILILMFS